MIMGLARLRKKLTMFRCWINTGWPGGSRPSLLDIGFFVVLSFANIVLDTAIFLTEIPIHLMKHPTSSFTLLARRGPNNEFLESYTSHLRRYRAAVASTLAMFLLLVGQLTFFGYQIYHVGKPNPALAYSSTVTISPSWDIDVYQDQLNTDSGDGSCVLSGTSYACSSATATTLNYGLSDQVSFFGTCSGGDLHNKDYHTALQFSLASVPAGATVTKVELLPTVTTGVAGTIRIAKTTSDTPSTLSCTDQTQLYDNIPTTGGYLTLSNWNTTGAKTVTLGATSSSAAAVDVQARIGGTIGIGISATVVGYSSGAIGSSENGSASLRPQLKVYYSAPPQTPTNPGHSAITTSSITWTWTDNASADTANYIHNASNTVMCTAGAVASTGSTGSCAESSLSTNTQYTRHINTVDADGNTDSATSASAYTAIEASTGISFGTVTSSSIAVTSTNTPSNLASGTSGLYFQESVLSTNSGWVQTNGWTIGALSPNTQYSFEAKSRNGDSVETSLTSASTKYTLSATPNVASARSTSTWYTSGTFDFTNAAGWGAGGVQYYRYVWDQVASHTFAGSESTWSDANAKCPGGTCTTANATLANTATDGNDWYLHVQSFNAADVANGSGTNYGPYEFDSTNPSTPATVNDGTGSDATYQTSTSQLSANWTAATDATSGLQKYQYAVGSTSGGTDIVNWTDTGNGTTASMTKTGLSLTNGTKYYLSVRALDNAGNTGSATSSNGVTVNTSLPSITNNQTGDTTPRNAAGTTYNVDFAKASSGPQLDYGQYAVYSGANKTGTLLKDWTDIFRSPVDSYATNWSVDFTSLQEGTNYVSVKVAALDGLANELDDAFTITKDTTGPSLTSFVAAESTTSAVLTWTTNEAATSQIEYGTTTSYGTTTTADAALVTSHSVTITGLAANTTFHARARSTDQAGNETVSADLSFTTSAGAKTLITNVKATVVDTTTVTITWTTNEAATSKVRYGTTTDYGLEVADATLVTSHSVTLTGLTPNTVYHYEVLSTGTTTDNDADATFATSVTEELPIPVKKPTAGVPTPLATPTLVAPLNGSSTADQMSTIIGRGPAKSTLFIIIDRAIAQTVLIDATGSFVTKLPTALDVGTHTINLRARASDGRLSSESKTATFTITTPAVAAPTLQRTNVVDGENPIITVKLVNPADASVKILIDGKVVKTIAPVDTSTASYGLVTSVAPSDDLTAGHHIVTVVSVDAHGRPSRSVVVTTFHKKGTDGQGIQYSQPVKYTVKANDSLWSIAKTFSGDGRNWLKIVQANVSAHPSLLTDPSVIRIGWCLTLPKL